MANVDETAVVRRLPELQEIGSLLAKSGYFQDAKEMAQAVVKVLAGREIGIPPIASMTGINIIKGRVSLSANIMAALVKRSGKYNYTVKELTDTACELHFFEGQEMIGVSRFDASDAKRAETQNLQKFPRNMLFARAMSNGAKWYCADVFGGPVYTPEELGAKVDIHGEVVISKEKLLTPLSKAEAAKATTESPAAPNPTGERGGPESPAPPAGDTSQDDDAALAAEARSREQAEASQERATQPPLPKVDRQKVFTSVLGRAKTQGKTASAVLSELTAKHNMSELTDPEVLALAKKLEG